MKSFARAALALVVMLPLPQTPQFRSTVAVVRVDALVTDGKRPVRGLTAANFELRDNGVPQRILDLHFETLPVNVICALDVSSSVAGKPLEQLKEAFAALVDALGAEDRAALLTFSNRLQLHTRLTSDRNRLRAAANAVGAGGTTAFFDGAFAALALRDADEGRPLLLLFSDGIDTSSWLGAKSLLEASRRADVVIYPVTAGHAGVPPDLIVLSSPSGRMTKAPTPLEVTVNYVLGELADNTGGRVVRVDPRTTLRDTFLATLDEFRQRYVISYEPAGVAAGGWHAIDVKLKGRSGEVRARRGYAGG